MGSNTKEFKKLQQEYDDRLAEAGFHDIEDRNSPRENLKTWDSHTFRKIDPIVAEAIRDYFSAAQALLHEREFRSELEKRIWELHSKGLQLMEIAKETRQDRQKIYRVVKRIKKEILGA